MMSLVPWEPRVRVFLLPVSLLARSRFCSRFQVFFRVMKVVGKIVAAVRDEFDNPPEPIEMKMTVKE